MVFAHRPRLIILTALAAAAPLTLACEGAGGDAELDVLLEAESVIIDGLSPGEGVENIRDGWTVDFSQYVAVVGEIDIHLSTDEEIEGEAPEAYAIDLTTIPPAGVSKWRITELAEGTYEFFYGTHGAGEASRDDSVSEADFAEMQASDWTYLINGTLTKADGISCPPASLATPGGAAVDAGTTNSAGDPCYVNTNISFRIGAEAETVFGPCEIDGTPGVVVTSGATQTAAITIHGDHIFFNGFPEGSEGGTLRLAQWLADSDLDLDGAVTQAELEAISPSDLVELDDRYQLGGSPITPLNTMWDYVRAQLKTQGHFQGEGECPADGVGHSHDDHDHDHG